MPLLPPPPSVPKERPPNTFLVTLLIYPNHWAYYIPSPAHPSLGILLHVTGDTRTGFKLAIQRSYDLSLPENQNPPTTYRIPLQWVDGWWLDEEKMLNNGAGVRDCEPACAFERVVGRVEMPGLGEGLDDEGDKVSLIFSG